MSIQTSRDDQTEPLPNPIRGCGTLKRGKAYFVGAGFAEGGVLPSWVEIDPHLPFREIGTEGEFTRSYQHIDGLTLQLALEEAHDFIEHYPGEERMEEDEALSGAMQNHVEAGVYDEFEAVPTNQADRHIDRVRARGLEGGSHWGNIPVADQTDFLMRCGASYYPSPADYVDEAIEHGLSKAIPVSKGNIPTVASGVTRCWVMHPKACEGYGGGIIGFAYLSEVAFTEPEDGELPDYIEQADEVGELTVRDIEDPPEEPEEEEEESPDATIGDFNGGDDDDE